MFKGKKMAAFFSGLKSGLHILQSHLTVDKPSLISLKDGGSGISADFVYTYLKCLRTRSQSGKSPRQSAAIFISTSSSDGVCATGNFARPSLCGFLNTPSTLSFKSELVGFEISQRSNHVI